MDWHAARMLRRLVDLRDAVIRALVAPAALVQIQAEARRTIQRRLARLIWTSLIIAVVAGGLWLVLEASDLAPEPGFASIFADDSIVLLETHSGCCSSRALASC